MIRDLASQGADINNQDYYKETPLHRAVGRGDTAAVELLLRIGADRNIANMNKKAPYMVAKNEATISVFANISEEGQDQLLSRAVKEESWTIAGILVARGAATNNIDGEGCVHS